MHFLIALYTCGTNDRRLQLQEIHFKLIKITGKNKMIKKYSIFNTQND